MTNFLFWNIGKQNRTEIIVSLAHQHNVDVLILAESDLLVPSMGIAQN